MSQPSENQCSSSASRPLADMPLEVFEISFVISHDGFMFPTHSRYELVCRLNRRSKQQGQREQEHDRDDHHSEQRSRIVGHDLAASIALRERHALRLAAERRCKSVSPRTLVLPNVVGVFLPPRLCASLVFCAPSRIMLALFDVPIALFFHALFSIFPVIPSRISPLSFGTAISAAINAKRPWTPALGVHELRSTGSASDVLHRPLHAERRELAPTHAARSEVALEGESFDCVRRDWLGAVIARPVALRRTADRPKAIHGHEPLV